MKTRNLICQDIIQFAFFLSFTIALGLSVFWLKDIKKTIDNRTKLFDYIISTISHHRDAIKDNTEMMLENREMLTYNRRMLEKIDAKTGQLKP